MPVAASILRHGARGSQWAMRPRQRAFGWRTIAEHSMSGGPTAASASYSEQQQRLGRPVSPHVTIYRQPLTAISSILNRVSGVALAMGFVGGSAYSALGGDVPALLLALRDTAPKSAPLIKFLVAFPLSYHWLCGVRHARPETINLKDAPRSSLVVLLGALVGSAAMSLVVLPPRQRDQGGRGRPQGNQSDN